MTLLRCGHLGDSEFKECTVIYLTKACYKRSEAPRHQEVVLRATLKQKKHIFYFFTPHRFSCVMLLGCEHLEDSEFK